MSQDPLISDPLRADESERQRAHWEREREGLLQSLQLMTDECHAAEVRYRMLLANTPELFVLVDARSGLCVDASDQALGFFGLSRERLRARNLPELSAPAQSGGVDAGARHAQLCELALAGQPQQYEWCFLDAQANEVDAEVRLVALSEEPGVLRAGITDISARRRGERITAGERNVFERIAADAPLSEVLGAIVEMVESISPSFIAAISRLGADQRSFCEVIGPRLPARLRAVVERTTIDIRNGSSAACVYLGTAVLTADVANDAFWQRRRQLALECGVRAAWAVPIRQPDGRMLGALTVYRPHVGGPQPSDTELLVHAARLASIAIERRRGEAALRESEAKFRNLYERVLDGVYQCAPDGRLLEVNPAFVTMLGYASAEELYVLESMAMLYWNPGERVEFQRNLDQHGEIRNAELMLRRRDGSRLVVLESARVVRDAEQQLMAYEGTLTDITARSRAERSMFAEKERAQVTLQSIGDAVITTDAEGRIDYLNPVAEQLTGWSAEEARGRGIDSVLRLYDELTHAELENPLLRCLRDGATAHINEHIVLRNRLGQDIGIQDSAAPIRDRDGQIAGAVIVLRDVTQERRLKRALSYQASHDALTGLINRREFDNRLEEALQSARRGEGPHALLYVDLDQFKVVNDTCGHTAGDRLLRDVTGILQAQVRAADTIARLGGDEFGVLARACTIDQAATIADEVRRAIGNYRFTWGELVSGTGASIGVVEICEQSQSVANLMSAADIACYAAKEGGRNRVHLYESNEASGRHRELYWMSRLTRAVDENRLELHFQRVLPVRTPAVETGAGTAPLTDRPRYCELLVRLRDENGTLSLPGDFVPAAERYNVISKIDRWALRSAVRLLSQQGARATPIAPLLLAVNVSGSSLADRSFLEFVLAQIEAPHIARALCFEFTETAVISSRAQAASFLEELRRRGCRLALDDFGSGLSSFHQLKSLPVDYVKIDGRFVSHVATDAVDRSMVEAISQVCHTLGIATIAEQVESEPVLLELARLGVDYAQGNLLGAPAPVDQLLRGGPA